MKKSLKDETETVDERALAQVTGDDLAPVNQGPVGLGEVSGEIDERDLKVPVLKITHGVGDLSAVFNLGDLIINNTHKIAGRDEFVNMTVLSIRKYYEENLPYDANGPMPQMFNTKAEVVAAGLTTEWINNQPPSINEVGEMTLLLEQREGVDEVCFSTEFEGKKYAMARFTVRKTQYGAAKDVFTARAMQLSECGLLFGAWTIHTESKPLKSGNRAMIPVLKLTGKHPVEFVEFIKERYA